MCVSGIHGPLLPIGGALYQDLGVGPGPGLEHPFPDHDHDLEAMAGMMLAVTLLNIVDFVLLTRLFDMWINYEICCA